MSPFAVVVLCVLSASIGGGLGVLFGGMGRVAKRHDALSEDIMEHAAKLSRDAYEQAQGRRGARDARLCAACNGLRFSPRPVVFDDPMNDEAFFEGAQWTPEQAARIAATTEAALPTQALTAQRAPSRECQALRPSDSLYAPVQRAGRIGDSYKGAGQRSGAR